MAIKRIFTLIEDDEAGLSGRIVSFDVFGAKASTEDVDLSGFPDNIVTAFFGPVEQDVTDESSPKRGHLPDGFPGKAALEAVDAGTYAKVRALIAKGDKWWNEVPGVGPATAAEVEAAV